MTLAMLSDLQMKPHNIACVDAKYIEQLCNANRENDPCLWYLGTPCRDVQDRLLW